MFDEHFCLFFFTSPPRFSFSFRPRKAWQLSRKFPLARIYFISSRVKKGEVYSKRSRLLSIQKYSDSSFCKFEKLAPHLTNISRKNPFFLVKKSTLEKFLLFEKFDFGAESIITKFISALFRPSEFDIPIAGEK